MCLCTWDLKSTVKAACVYGDLSKRCRKLRRTGQVARRIEIRNNLQFPWNVVTLFTLPMIA